MKTKLYKNKRKIINWLPILNLHTDTKHFLTQNNYLPILMCFVVSIICYVYIYFIKEDNRV